jgi:hypothetical protein
MIRLQTATSTRDLLPADYAGGFEPCKKVGFLARGEITPRISF